MKLPNPKYIPKPYEQMQYPGQRVQINVKFVPEVCIVGQEKGTKWYQYTFLDEYTRFRYLKAFEEHNTYTFAVFLRHVVEKFPCAIEWGSKLTTGAEFTKHCKDNEEFCVSHRFYSFEDFKKQLAVR